MLNRNLVGTTDFKDCWTSNEPIQQAPTPIPPYKRPFRKTSRKGLNQFCKMPSHNIYKTFIQTSLATVQIVNLQRQSKP